MASTTFNGPVRSEKGFQVATKNTSTGAAARPDRPLCRSRDSASGLCLARPGSDLARRTRGTVRRTRWQSFF